MIYKKIVLLLGFFFIFYQIQAQNIDKQKYSLAQSYEKSGDIKNASRLYKELYDKNPNSEEIFQAIVRTYSAQNLFSDLKIIVEAKVKSKPSISVLCLYAELLWRSGNNINADKAWNDAISNYPDTPDKFIFVASSQEKMRQLDKAISTLINGRKAGKEETLFSNELSRLYIATGNYQDGLNEVLSYFNLTKDLPYAQGQVYALISNKQASEYLNTRLKEEARNQSENILIQNLYSFYLRTTKKFEEALEITKRIDDLKKAQGREILYFADLSRNDGEYDIALKAYAIIIDEIKANQLLATALYGYARTLEHKLHSKNKLTKDEIGQIIDRYNSIIEKYPNQSISADSRYRIALIAKEFLNDLPLATKELQELILKYPNTPVTAAANNELANIYIILDELDDAEKIYRKIILNFKKISPKDYEIAEYKIAEIAYYKGDIDTALAQFKEISARSGSDEANNALEKISLIEQNKQLTQALKTYANAELKEIQKNFSEALKLYKETSGLADGENLAELCFMRSAKIEFNNAHFIQTKEILSKLFEKYPRTIYGDQAYLLIGNSFISESNKDAAIKAFNDLLTNYPRSIYLQEARDKIRILRQDKF